MDKKMMLMRRTSLRTLGCVLMDISLPVEEALGEERSEEETLGMIRDDLGLALRNGGDNLKVRLERVVEEAWKQGKQAVLTPVDELGENWKRQRTRVILWEDQQ